LEEVFSRMAEEEITITGAGRTDAGVHALGQTAHFGTEKRLPETAWVRGANRLLPRDIVILLARYADPGFHARYTARSKTYEYHVLNRPLRSAFLDAGTWHVPQPLDLEGMKEAGRLLEGTHDFSSFRAAECGAKDPVKTLDRLEIQRGPGILPAAPDGEVIRFTFQAKSFLHHMIRNLMGTLIDVGKGKISPGEVERILAAKDRRRSGVTAPAQGLWLIRVEY
jgi:tRNA pseudouridine38-40 synthase